MRLRLFLPLASLFFVPLPNLLNAQTATLKEIHAEGLKKLTEAQAISLSGLATGAPVGRKELQDGADALVKTGLFAKVSYNFTTHNDALTLTFHLDENPRLPVSYDNFPWFADTELNDAVRKDLPFYDGTLPEGGTVVEQAASSLQAYLAAHGSNVQIAHAVLLNPLTEGSFHQFRVEGLAPLIASVEFSDTHLKDSLAVQQHLPEILGKPYSRLAIDIFLAEAMLPVYQEDGYLRAKIGPAEVRLSGNPNQKLPEQIPVYVPCQPGSVYHWNGAQWSGNQVLSTITLTTTLGLKPGDVANGMGIETGWDRIREEYGQRGYLEAKLTPTATYDDQANTVSYTVSIAEGPAFHFNQMIITGMSLAGERMIREAWPTKPGDVFDKKVFEQFLNRLEIHRDTIFKDLPLHYDTVGHWLQTDPAKTTVDVLLDFK
ncbi:MAG TPA: POTRA domain-containing protein [Candidatus Dormibacteraeota bacterium]|nr:POTRA domain-containing protein [Candidatus Dormibacteraeota bacterium]